MLKKILDDGFDINSKNSDGNPLIHIAAEAGSIDIVKLLVERGADFNAISLMKRSICHYACRSKKSINLVKYLFECGFDFNCQDEHGFTPLLVAILDR